MMLKLKTIAESVNVISVDQSQAPDVCEYCDKPGDLRPYGKDGAWICFSCAMSDEDETAKNFGKVLNGEQTEGMKITTVDETKDTNIAVDFDATIHSYENGFRENEFDAPIEGAITGVNELCGKYDKVFIFTAREILDPVEQYMKDEFEKQDIPYPENLEVTNQKPPADIYIVASNGVLSEMKINESAGDTFEFHLSMEPDLIEGKPFSQQIRTVSSEGERGDMGAEEKGVIYATDSPEDWYQQFESELADAPEFIPNNLYIVKVKNPSKGSHLSQSINKPEDVVVIEKVPNTDEGTPDFKRGYAMLNKLQKSLVTESKTSSIAVDFDHTVHSYENGFSDDHFDPPIPGAIEALQTLCDRYKDVHIFTARTKLQEVELWLKYQFKQTGIPYPPNLCVTNNKPIADIYVDDRGYQFTGDWDKTLEDVDTYKTWMNEHRLPTFAQAYARRKNR